jgi:hypothetical protein
MRSFTLFAGLKNSSFATTCAAFEIERSADPPAYG